VKTLISNKNRVFSEFEAAVDVDPTTVEEIEDLRDNEGVNETKTDEGRVAKEGGADRGTVGIFNIP